MKYSSTLFTPPSPADMYDDYDLYTLNLCARLALNIHRFGATFGDLCLEICMCMSHTSILSKAIHLL